VTSLRLIVLTNPVEGRENDFNDWYTGRHLDDVLDIEGFHAAQRFVFRPGKLSADSGFRYLAIYEVEGATLEEAEAALLAAAARKELMPISGAMARERATWWFEAITDRVEAPAADPNPAARTEAL
jgi:hypothetical protein